jgi:hypothetical protein
VLDGQVEHPGFVEVLGQRLRDLAQRALAA